MRTLCALIAISSLACSAAALDPANHASAPSPVKPLVEYQSPPPDAAVLRQGGDTIFSAFPVPTVQPQFHDTGTTVGYVNDYDAVCPYSGSTSPDVVYSYVVETAVGSLTVDLCYSSFDTKIYIYDSNLNLIACNDDFYFSAPCYIYSSRLDNVPICDSVYYFIVDGYGGASGTYDIVITPGVPTCDITCPTPNTPEGEAPMANGYVDDYDGGCNTPPDYPFKDLTVVDPGNPDHPDETGNLTLCGNAGWYLGSNGSAYRDSDWYLIQMGYGGEILVTIDALYPTGISELAPQDCASAAVVQSAIGGSCFEGQMTIAGYDEATLVWIRVGTNVSTPPCDYPDTYPYVCWFSGLEPGPVATRTFTWSTVKAMFD